MAMRRLALLVPCVVQICGAGLISAADLQLKVDPAPAPTELSQEVRGLLQATSLRLLDGEKAVMEFWLRAEIPLTSVPAAAGKSLDSLKQSALLGVVRIPSNTRDYRDDELPAGVYTMRFSLQPSDGDHLGTSDYAYFVALVPAKYDVKPDAIADYKALTKASSKDTSTGHPVILSLRPISGELGVIPSLQQPAPEHKCVRLRIPGKAGDARGEVVFDLVYAGKASK